MHSVSIHTLLSCLEKYHPVSNCTENIVFKNYQLYHPYYLFFPEDTLYILNGRDYAELPKIAAEVHSLLVIHEKIDIAFDVFTDVPSLIVLENDVETDELFRALDVLFDNKMSAGELHEELFRALCQDMELTKLMDLASELTGQALALSDMHLSEIYRTGYAIFPDVIDVQKTSDRQHLSRPDYYQALLDTPRFHSTTEKPVFYDPNDPRCRQIIPNGAPLFANGFIDCPLMQKGIRIGYLTLAGILRPVTEADLPFAETISQILSLEMSRTNVPMITKSSYYEAIFQDLIEEKISDTLVRNIRIRSLKKDLTGQLHIITVRPADSTKKSGYPVGMQEYLREYWKNCLSMHYQGQIVLLTSGDPLQEPLLGKIPFPEYLHMNHLIAGVSLTFKDPSKSKRFYDQSLKALSLGPQYYPDRSVFYYRDISRFDMLQQQAENNNLRDYCHPLVLRLSDSKLESDHELLQTLYVYLYSGCDTKIAAERLHIHRNTFYYRLEKLQDMLGNDLKSGDVIFQFMLSFEIIEYFSKLYTAENHLPMIGSIKHRYIFTR